MSTVYVEEYEMEHFADESEGRDLEVLNRKRLTRWELDELFC